MFSKLDLNKPQDFCNNVLRTEKTNVEMFDLHVRIQTRIHLLQLLQGDTEGILDQRLLGLSRGLLLVGHNLKHLPRTASRRHPKQTWTKLWLRVQRD